MSLTLELSYLHNKFVFIYFWKCKNKINTLSSLKIIDICSIFLLTHKKIDLLVCILGIVCVFPIYAARFCKIRHYFRQH